MFLESIKIVRTASCLEDDSLFKVIAIPSVCIGKLFPYLNAVLKPPVNSFYFPESNFLQIKKEKNIIGLYDTEISMTIMRNITEAYYELDLLKDIINDTYEKRDAIVPNFTGRKAPGILKLFNLLPKTNCKKCGEATCMAFASKLKSYQKEPSWCPELLREENAKAKAEIVRLLEGVV